MSEHLTDLSIGPWTLKLRIPEKIDGAPVYLLLHGWTGNENSMWVFTNKLDSDAFVVSPRGLFPSTHPEYEGFSWVQDSKGKWPGRDDFAASAGKLTELLDALADRFPADFHQKNLVGFSQGAALAGECLFSNPDHINRLAMLSGFLPEGTFSSDVNLINKKIFIGHGSRDETVPLEKAQEAGLLFEAAGAIVSRCFTDVGHRLGAECFRGFNHFFGNS